MQLGLWHLTLPNVLVLRNDSAAESFSASIAMTNSLFLILIILVSLRAVVHYHELFV
jgi:hypothetical protein